MFLFFFCSFFRAHVDNMRTAFCDKVFQNLSSPIGGSPPRGARIIQKKEKGEKNGKRRRKSFFTRASRESQWRVSLGRTDSPRCISLYTRRINIRGRFIGIAYKVL